MNKKLPLILLAAIGLCFGTLQAQSTLPNSGLENWTMVNGWEELVDWDNPNQLAFLLGAAERFVFEETTNVQDGTSAARLLTDSGKVGPPVNLNILVPGVITTGVIGLDIATLTPDVSGGAPFTARPTSLNGFYDYAPAGVDTMVVLVTLTKWDGTMANVVGAGEFRTITATTAYTEFQADITYFTTDDPDTMQVSIFSSGSFTSPKQGSELFVDNLFFPGVSGGLGSGEMSIKPTLYPNPAGEMLYVENPYNGPVEMTFYNILGKQVGSHILAEDLNTVPTADLPTGIYLYRFVQNNTVLNSGKVKVAH